MIRIYTDGAWRKNDKAAGGAAVIIWDDGSISIKHKFLGDVTNNCAELEAVKIGLESILKMKAQSKSVIVHSDSTYAIGILTKDWKAKANAELVNEILSIMDNFSDLLFKWVKSHSKDKYNRLADTLANIAIDQYLGIDQQYNNKATRVHLET